MKKAIILIIGCLLLSLSAWAVVDTMEGKAITSTQNIEGTTAAIDDVEGQEVKAAAAGCGADYCEDFEGTGAPTNWAGTSDYDFDTTGLSMSNTQCVQNAPGESFIYDPNLNASSLYVTFWLRFDGDMDGTRTILSFYDTGSTPICAVKLVDSGAGTTSKLWVESGGGSFQATQQSSSALDVNTTYKIKVYAKSSTGSNDGICNSWVWNGSSWVSWTTDSDGTRTNNIDSLYLPNVEDTENLYYDMFKISATDISSPD